jgi:hypothetical protein
LNLRGSCFNIALVSYLRRLIQQKGVGLGEGGVHVYHFFELWSAKEIVMVQGQKVSFVLRSTKGVPEALCAGIKKEGLSPLSF